MRIYTTTDIAPFSGFWRPWISLAQAWRVVTAHWAAGYRPEKHYMRGPGPKWRAKHAQPDGVLAH